MKLFRLTRGEGRHRQTILVGTVDIGRGAKAENELEFLIRLREPGETLEVWSPRSEDGVVADREVFRD